MAKRNLTLKQCPSDRNRILDGDNNLVFVCVSGFASDADELVKNWDMLQDTRRNLEKITEAYEEIKRAVDEAESAIDEIKESLA
jgi:hypothetical protein